MLGANNDYFYGEGAGKGAGLAAGADDEFWYGDDKPGEDQPLAANEYQSYIANTGGQDQILGKK